MRFLGIKIKDDQIFCHLILKNSEKKMKMLLSVLVLAISVVGYDAASQSTETFGIK